MREFEIKNIEQCPVHREPDFDRLCRLTGDQNVLAKDAKNCPFACQCSKHIANTRPDELDLNY